MFRYQVRDIHMTDTNKNGFVPVENGELFYQQSGLGEQQVLWVHGLPLDSRAWYPQLQYFNQRCQNTVFDLRGYGKSSKLPEHPNDVTDIYMNDFLSVLEYCHLEKPTLVGFASAGHAVLRFAALFPDKISKLIVINGSPCFMKCDSWEGGFSSQSLKDMASKIELVETDDEIYDDLLSAAMNEHGGEALKALKAWYMKLAKGSGRATINAFFSSIATDDDRALMSRIIAPTLIISSRLGQEVPSGTALFLRQTIPNSQLFELNDIDHFAYATKSGLLNQVIEQFISPQCDINLPTNLG